MSVTLSTQPIVASGEPVITEQGGRVTIGLLDSRGTVTTYVPMDPDAARAAAAALLAMAERADGHRADAVIADAWRAAVTAADQEDDIDRIHAWLHAHPLSA